MNKQENIYHTANEVIEVLDLRYYIDHAKIFMNVDKERFSINEIKLHISHLGKNDYEKTYLFANKVIKQLQMMLCA
jgi:hypothetical protein